MSNRIWLVRGSAVGAYLGGRRVGPLAFPGAMGAAAATPGGRGGQLLRVTTLAAAGPGSFLEAVKQHGPRIVVFEVGGVIDLAESTVKITEPYLTIAGQTAPGARDHADSRRHRHRHARRGGAPHPRAAGRRRPRRGCRATTTTRSPRSAAHTT